MAVSEEIQEKMLEEAYSVTPNYSTDYSDERFGKVESDYKQDLTELEQTYGGMIGNTDQFYDKQIQASKDWADKQTQIQQDNTDFAIEKIEQQKDQAHKDYLKEQSGAYVDWQKQSNQYGVNAEKMAAAGLDKSGYSESSQVSMYNTYQNRVATARETYNRAVLNYDNAIKDAQLQNNAALAEIAYQSLQKQLELGLQGFQYKNQLILDLSAEKRAIKSEKWQKEQAVIEQQNWEKQMAEQRWQYEDNQRFTAEQNTLDRQHQEKLQMLDQEFEAKQNEINREHDKVMAKIEQDYKIAYLNAETAAQKKLIKAEYDEKIRLANQEKANAIAIAREEAALAKAAMSATGRSVGSAVSSAKKGKSSNTTAVTPTKNSVAANYEFSADDQTGYPDYIDVRSVLDLGYGPISFSKLKEYVSNGTVVAYQSGGKTKFKRKNG